MFNPVLKLAAAALALSITASANAATRSIYISPATMGVQPVYRSDVLNPVILTDAGRSTFRVGFMLPADYAVNTVANLRLHLQAATRCSIVLGVLYLDRTRVGQPVHETSPPSLDGMTNGNVAIVNLPAQKVAARSYDFAAPARASFTGQKPGDGFLVWFERSKTNPLDTCGLVTIWHAEVRYTATP